MHSLTLPWNVLSRVAARRTRSRPGGVAAVHVDDEHGRHARAEDQVPARGLHEVVVRRDDRMVRDLQRVGGVVGQSEVDVLRLGGGDADGLDGERLGGVGVSGGDFPGDPCGVPVVDAEGCVQVGLGHDAGLERVGADDAPVLMPVGVEESDGGEQLVSHHAALVLVPVPFRGSLRLVRRVERVACDLDGAEGVREVERDVLPWAAGVDRDGVFVEPVAHGFGGGLRLVPDGQALPREGLREGLCDPCEQVGLLGLVECEVGQDAALLLDVLDVLFGVVATVLEMRVLPGWRGVAGYVGHDGPP